MNPDSFNPKFFWRPLAIVVAFAFLYSGVLTKLGRDWWSDENYSHGLLVPFVIGFIIWSEWDEIRAIRLNPSSLLGIVVIVTAFLLLLGGTLGAELLRSGSRWS
ncbi:MAG: archaeosortase/exosortase family protein [Acidobacteria bacterium]|nr:archaeosortase/exosortase family protein [Acidobacteriota bacterium]